MKGYPFVRYVVALMAGIGLYVAQPTGWVWPAVAAGLGAVGYVAGWLGRPTTRSRGVQGIGILLLLLALGWFTTYVRTAANRPDNISHLRQPLTAYVGVIDAQPETRARTYRVELALQRGYVRRGYVRRGYSGRTDSVSATPLSGRWQPLSGRVIIYLDKADVAKPRYGEQWLVLGAPRPIDPPLNPGEFNYKRYLSFRNIYHQQYLRPWQRYVVGHTPPLRLMAWATAVNRWADSVFTAQLGSRAEYGLVNAMLLGVRDNLDPAQYRAYAAAGAVHILSVSGLHVGILFLVLTALLRWLAPGQESRWWVAALKLAVLWFYALVTGFSPPVLRSAGMLSLLILAEPGRLRTALPAVAGASGFFILCADPYALFAAGFQLSYLAVLGIGAWGPPLSRLFSFRQRGLRWLWQLSAVALVAQAATFPLAVYYFHTFPPYFLLANPVVMALSQVLLPLAMAALALSGVPYVADALGWALRQTTGLLNASVEGVSRLPGALWDGLWLSPAELVLTYGVLLLGVALLLSRRRAYLYALTINCLLLSGLLLYDVLRQRTQQRLAVHFLPHRTAVSVTAGTATQLLTDADLTANPRPYEFYLKNTFGLWGVRSLRVVHLRAGGALAAADTMHRPAAFHQTRSYALWVCRGKSVLLINRLTGRPAWQLPAVVDYCVVRRNALRNWAQLRGRVVARHLILDDSNKTPLTDRLLADARRQGIVCHSVRQMGAYVVELDERSGGNVVSR